MNYKNKLIICRADSVCDRMNSIEEQGHKIMNVLALTNPNPGYLLDTFAVFYREWNETPTTSALGQLTK